MDIFFRQLSTAWFYQSRNASARRLISSLPVPPKYLSLTSPLEVAAAREWTTEFQGVTIPHSSIDLSFSKSSGPGGQNVNKVNTKATVRCPVTADWIPGWARPHLRHSPSYVQSSDSLLINSTRYRSQAQNIDDCLEKLHVLVLDSAMQDLHKESSETQRKRVEDLQKAEKARRAREKTHRSEIKKQRSRVDFDK